jgi:DNA-binding CsgD family transcriptional regulator
MAGHDRLSARELEVVRYAARGLSSAATAPLMFISEETVKSHRRHIIQKLDARNMTHAVAIVAMNAPDTLR